MSQRSHLAAPCWLGNGPLSLRDEDQPRDSHGRRAEHSRAGEGVVASFWGFGAGEPWGAPLFRSCAVALAQSAA